MRTPWLVCLLFLLLSCAALRDDMRRAESAYDQARYEDVMVWVDDLAPHVADMEQPMRARFYYLRGLTAYRLGRRVEARHSLALCRVEAGPGLAALKPEWRPHLESALRDLGVGPRGQERELSRDAPPGAEAVVDARPRAREQDIDARSPAAP